MTNNVFGGTLKLAQSNPIHDVVATSQAKIQLYCCIQQHLWTVL